MASIASKVKVDGESIALDHSLTNVDFSYYADSKGEELVIATDVSCARLSRRELDSLVSVLRAVGVI
jgi:hypothetical protein